MNGLNGCRIDELGHVLVAAVKPDSGGLRPVVRDYEFRCAAQAMSSAGWPSLNAMPDRIQFLLPDAAGGS